MEGDAGQRRSSSAFSDAWKVPELPLASLSFAFHFVWEFPQVPTFEGMATRPHWEGIKVCTFATLGDVGLALVAFWMTAGVFRSRQWIAHPRPSQIALFVAVGIALTVGLEFPSDPMGKLFFNILATFAEFEADLIRMRTREGMARARSRGKLRSKKPKLSERQQKELSRMYDTGDYSVSDLAEACDLAADCLSNLGPSRRRGGCIMIGHAHVSSTGQNLEQQRAVECIAIAHSITSVGAAGAMFRKGCGRH